MRLVLFHGIVDSLARAKQIFAHGFGEQVHQVRRVWFADVCYAARALPIIVLKLGLAGRACQSLLVSTVKMWGLSQVFFPVQLPRSQHSGLSQR